MNTIISLLCLLPFISSTLPSPPECNSKNTDNEFCMNKQEGFTREMSSNFFSLWKKHLAQFAHKEGLNFLEIGTYEGRSALWLLENVLTHPTSMLTCIDPWTGNQNIFTRFSNNIKKYIKKINVVRDFSSNALRKYELVPFFDVIYIDGCHNARCVIEDMVLSFPLLKPGGLMIIDDYKWRRDLPEEERPQLAADTFLKIFKNKLKVLHEGYQMIIKKKGGPVTKKKEL